MSFSRDMIERLDSLWSPMVFLSLDFIILSLLKLLSALATVNGMVSARLASLQYCGRVRWRFVTKLWRTSSSRCDGRSVYAYTLIRSDLSSAIVKSFPYADSLSSWSSCSGKFLPYCLNLVVSSKDKNFSCSRHLNLSLRQRTSLSTTMLSSRLCSTFTFRTASPPAAPTKSSSRVFLFLFLLLGSGCSEETSSKIWSALALIDLMAPIHCSTCPRAQPMFSL